METVGLMLVVLIRADDMVASWFGVEDEKSDAPGRGQSALVNVALKTP